MRRPAERLTCPEDIQRDLTDIFGVNHFGDPMFRIIWGMTETQVQLTVNHTYDDVLVGANQPCWILQRWEPPEVFGTPDFFYLINRDDETGMVMMEYPDFGKYKDLVSFQSRHYDAKTHELKISTIELDWTLIDAAVPLMLKSLEMSDLERQAALEEQQAYENALIVNEIADRLHDDLPTFYGPTSHAQISNRTALIDRKKAEIERMWRLMDLRRAPARGFYQGKPN